MVLRWLKPLAVVLVRDRCGQLEYRVGGDANRDTSRELTETHAEDMNRGYTYRKTRSVSGTTQLSPVSCTTSLSERNTGQESRAEKNVNLHGQVIVKRRQMVPETLSVRIQTLV